MTFPVLSLIHILALGCEDEIKRLFTSVTYDSIEERVVEVRKTDLYAADPVSYTHL